MEIQVKATNKTPVAADDTRPSAFRITIDMDGREDPAGHIWGLLINDRLESLLRLYGQGRDVQTSSAGDLWGLLVDAGKIVGRLDEVTTALMWAARDTAGMSWGEIESAMEIPRGTIRKTVERTRAANARAGFWRDEAGLHRESDHEAAADRAAARAAELSTRRRPGDRIGYRLDEPNK
jgi:hypothetical protein